VNKTDHNRAPSDLIDEVDELNEEVKSLALNLAIYLAKAKNRMPEAGLDALEPAFIRLVNGTVKVVQEMASLLAAARSGEAGPPTGKSSDPSSDLEMKLRSISEQCRTIQHRLEAGQASGGDTPDGSADAG